MRVFHVMVKYWAVMVNREVMRIIAMPLLDPIPWQGAAFVRLHMVRNVWACWSERVKLGATTAIPTITPKWEARARRSANCQPQVSLRFVPPPSTRNIAGPTEDAVRYKSDIEQTKQRPVEPQETAVHISKLVLDPSLTMRVGKVGT